MRLRGVEQVGHRRRQPVVEPQRLQPQHRLDRAQDVDRRIAGRDDRALPDIGAGHERERSARIDMVGTVLGIVLDDEHQRRAGDAAVGDRLDDHAERVIIVGHFRFDRAHPVDRLLEVAEVIVAEAQQRQGRDLAGRIGGVELAPPFQHAPIIGEFLIEAAEIGIAALRQQPVPGRVDARARLPRFADHRYRAGRAGIVDRGVGKAVVAHRKARADRLIPQEALVPVIVVVAIGRGQQGRAGKQIGVLRQHRVRRLTLGRGLLRVDEAVCFLRFIGEAALRIVHGRRLFEQVGRARRGRPGPAGARLLSRIVEIVERRELARKAMVVRRQRPAEDGEMRIAVADLQVAQHLVVGAVLLDDEDDVADPRPDRRHVRLGGGAGGGPGKPDIVGDLKRRRGQRLVVRQREFQHPRFFQLVDILVRRTAGIGLTAIDGELRRAALRVGAGRALAVDDEHALVIGRRRHRAGIPAGRHQPRDGPAGGARGDDGDGIDPAQRHQQSPVA